MTGIFISWTAQNGRTADLSAELGLTPHYVHRPGRYGLLGRYGRQLLATRKLIADAGATSIVLMLPPAIALLALPLRAQRGDTRLVCDLHTGFFLDPKWRWAAKPALAHMRRLGATAIVTGAHLRDECERAGVPAIVLHDVIGAGHEASAPGSYLLCPVSYANDEPIAEILAAARLTPHVEWRLTGKAPAAVRESAPDNVVFTGFVDDASYAELLRGALGVVALTTRPHTMQRAGYEAFSAGVPQITSDFAELREFYADSALFVSAVPETIAAAADTLAEQRASLVAALRRVREGRTREQRSALSDIRQALILSPAQTPAAQKGDQ